MHRIMWLIYFVLSFASLDAQNSLNEISYTGVYKGTPLFVQNPYLSHLKKYCIQEITVNKQRLILDYNRSALIINFESNEKYSPVSIKITFADSTCVPIFLNPNAIEYHSVFGFGYVAITDSSLVWQSRGEDSSAAYEVEEYYLGSWQVVETVAAKGVYGGAEYACFPNFRDGTNKFRMKYVQGDRILYSEEVENVFYPQPITFKRKGNILVLSRGCDYIVYDADNVEVLMGSGKEIDISSIPSGEYSIGFNEREFALFRKNDAVKVIKPPKSNN